MEGVKHHKLISVCEDMVGQKLILKAGGRHLRLETENGSMLSSIPAGGGNRGNTLLIGTAYDILRQVSKGDKGKYEAAKRMLRNGR